LRDFNDKENRLRAGEERKLQGVFRLRVLVAMRPARFAQDDSCEKDYSE